MFRKFLIALAGLLVLLIVLVIGAQLILDPVIAKFRPQIQKLVSKSLGSQVEFQRLSAQLFPEVALEVEDVHLAESSETTKTLRVGRLLLGTSLGDLYSGDINVNRLVLSDVDIPLLRDHNGNLRILGLSQKKELSAEPRSNKPQSAATPKKSSSEAVRLAINKAEFRNVRLSFRDEKLSPVLQVDNIVFNGSLENFDIQTGGDLKLTGTFLGSGENFMLNGAVGTKPTKFGAPALHLQGALGELGGNEVDRVAQAYGISHELWQKLQTNSLQLRLHVDSEKANVEFALSSQPGASLLQLSATLNKEAGQLRVTPLHLTILGQAIEGRLEIAEKKGPVKTTIQSTKLELSSLGDLLQIPALQGTTLEGVKADARYHTESKTGAALLSIAQGVTQQISFANFSITAQPQPDEVIVKDLRLQAFGGDLRSSGKILLSPQATSEVLLSAQGLDLAQVFAATKSTSSIGLTGTLADLRSDVSFKREAPSASMVGKLTAQAVNGTITGVNIVGETLSAVQQIPGLSEKLDKLIAPEHQETLRSKSTEFQKLVLKTVIADQIINLHEFELQHSLYTIVGRGTLGFSGSMDLNVQLNLSPTLTAGMLRKEKNLKYLLDANGLLVVPVVLHKSETGSTTVLPDISKLVNAAGKNAAGEAAGKALDKVAPGLGKGASKLLNSLF